MKSILFAAGLAFAVPAAARAQIVIQTVPPPGVRIVDPDDYWRHRREGEREAEWRRREEFREEARREDWHRAHCVRDWRNEEFCRR